MSGLHKILRACAAPLLGALGTLSCVHPLPEPSAPPPGLASWSAAVDWDAAGQEAARVLSGYLQVDTQNPPGNETAGARYLAALLRREGIASEIVEFTPGRGSLIARVKGNGAERPLCLLSHIDVAEADAKHWKPGIAPLSGKIDDEGMIWGRGALDMKGMGAIELQTLIWLKRLQVPLKRDVILLAVADEEDKNRGMQHVMQRHWDKIKCSHLINEGGIGLKDGLFAGQTVFPITVAEKGVLWLRMHVKGAAGHGSTPLPGQTPEKLLAAVERVRKLKPTPRVHDSLVELLARVGQHRGGLTGFVMQRPALVHSVVVRQLMGKATTRAAITDTCNLTGLSTGGNQPNVIPSSASATFDCRLLPGTTPAEMIRRLHAAVGWDPAVTFEQLTAAGALTSPWDDPLFEALRRNLIAGRDDAAAGPALSVGFTDSLYARQRGVRAYGMVPFEVSLDEVKTMHAPNERVSSDNVRRGLRILFSTVVEVSAAAGGAAPGRPRRPPAFRPVGADELRAVPGPTSAPAR